MRAADPHRPSTTCSPTGLDVEARPPGKKIKRLSLLSGGERSLVAVALLVSIFTARPSPFYILDEVEAALDDANLGRLILLLEELRDSSQLIVITHQKRTMEIADALRRDDARRRRHHHGVAADVRDADRRPEAARRRDSCAGRPGVGGGGGPGAERRAPTALGDGPYLLSPWLSWT